MSIAESILPEFEHEMAGTRKTIERAPDDKWGWKAHPKSNSIGWVVSHLAEIPGWVEPTLTGESWDIQPPGGEPYHTHQVANHQEALAIFDKNVAEAQRAIAATPDTEYYKNWSLLMNGEAVITMPRIGVIRAWVLNHTIHHRAILTVYLRLNDVPVPGLYGPSGDEE